MKRKRKEEFMLFSDYNGNLLRLQPGVHLGVHVAFHL